MDGKFKIGDVELLKETLHYDIISVNCTLDFMESKSEAFFKAYKKNNKIKIDNKTMIEMTEQERRAFFDYIYLDQSILEQYICEMLCIQIHSSLENFLYGVCELITNKRMIRNSSKNSKDSTFKAYVDIINNNFIKLEHKEIYKELDNWRKIRNSIVHNKKTLTEYKVKLVRGVVEIDDTCAPYQYTFGVFTKNIREYLVLVEDYTKSIYKELCLILNNKS